VVKLPLPAELRNLDWVRVSSRCFLSTDMVRVCGASFATTSATFQAFAKLNNSIALDALPRLEGELLCGCVVSSMSGLIMLTSCGGCRNGTVVHR